MTACSQTVVRRRGQQPSRRAVCTAYPTEPWVGHSAIAARTSPLPQLNGPSGYPLLPIPFGCANSIQNPECTDSARGSDWRAECNELCVVYQILPSPSPHIRWMAAGHPIGRWKGRLAALLVFARVPKAPLVAGGLFSLPSSIRAKSRYIRRTPPSTSKIPS
jgi:hypothetical protein